MSPLQEKINFELKEAIKSGDSSKTGVLRMIIASFHNKEIEKRGKDREIELSEEEIIDLLLRESKKRKEAAEIYKQGGRQELAEKELEEAKIIQKYLPEQLSREELEKIIDAAIKSTGASTVKDLGKVMGETMKQAKGRADSKLVSESIKNKLGV